MKEKQKKSRLKKAIRTGTTLAAGAGLAAVVSNRKAIGASASKGYKNLRRKATKGKYTSRRGTVSNIVTREVVARPRINTKARRQAAVDSMSEGVIPTNREINKRLVTKRRQALGSEGRKATKLGGRSTKGRTPGEIKAVRSAQKKASKASARKAKRLKRDGQYDYFNRLMINAEFKTKNPIKKYQEKRRNRRRANNALTAAYVAGTVASGLSLANRYRKLKKPAYIPDVSKVTARDLRRK